MDDEGHRVNRFKHQSYNQTLQDVHAPSALAQTQFTQEIGDNDSQFHESLEHWKQLNLAPSFLSFAQRVGPLSASMPLLLHNWTEIVELWFAASKTSDDEGLRALLDLLQKLVHDLRTTIAPVYPDLLDHLLQLLPRSISASALTALLAAFSVLFRHFLTPSVDLQFLEETWTSLRRTVAKSLPEIRRAMAEVWGSVLRRLKSSAREKAVTLVAEHVESMEDASAWIFVFACKSVSQTLHTATASIMTPLLTYHLTCDNPSATHTLIRRVLTALIHHVKNAEQFSPIGDVLVQEFCVTAKTCGVNVEKERFRRMLEVIFVPCSVRQGSRLSQKQLSVLLVESSSSPIDEILHAALLKFSTAVLTAGDITLWMGPGRQFLERSREYASFTIRLHGALAELGWGGWKSIALPAVLKMTPQLLERVPRETLALFAALHREKKLGEVDLVWRQRVETWILGWLTNWETSHESAMELEDVLMLSSFFPSVKPLLIKIVDVTLGSAESTIDHKDSLGGSAWVVGACMQVLAKRNSNEVAPCIDLVSWTRKCVKKWGWSENVLGGLVALSHTSASEGEPLSCDELYPFLCEGILSHSRTLRLNTLRFLGSSLIKLSSPGTDAVLRRCLQGEEVELEVQGVRERVLHIGRVSQVLRDGDEIGADICARWLIGQLKVNLRPLWSPAVDALASLSQQSDDLVWRLLFHELQAVSQPHPSTSLSDRVTDANAQDDDSNDPWEEERSWRDPSAHKIRSVVGTWLDKRPKSARVQENPRDRLDYQSYEFQLLSSLGKCSSLAEKHNRDLVPFFLSLAGPDAVSKLSRQKLSAWLTLFSKFSNPKALNSTDTLHSLYISILSHPDRSLQSLALSCIFTYKSPHLSPYQDQINALLDDTRWRDELTSLDLGQIEPQHRPEVIHVLIRLLFGLMLEKRGRTRGSDRRAAILSTLAACTEQELGLLVDLMLRPFHSDRTSRRGGSFSLNVQPDGTSEKQQIGFLTLLGDVLTKLGPKLVSYWPALLGTTVDLIGIAQARIDAPNHAGEVGEEDDNQSDDEEDVDEEPFSSSSKITRSVRQLGLKRFADFFRCPVSFDFTAYMKESFTSFISPRLSSLDKENTQAPSALLELFYVWTLQGDNIKFLVNHDDRLLPKVYDCLIAVNVKPAVVSRIFDIVDRLLESSKVDNFIVETVIKPHVSLLLTNLAILTERTKGVASVSIPLAQRQIGILSEIAQYCTDAEQASALFDLFAPLLRKPAKLVPEKVKVDLLKILGNLMGLIPGLRDRDTDVYAKTYMLLSQLFQTLRSRQARLALVSAFRYFSLIDATLETLAGLMESLNAYSTRRVEEPDFDRRLGAFVMLNETLFQSLSEQDWLPLLYNMLNFIQDPAELAVRNNASFALRHFVDFVATGTAPQYDATFMRILYPGLKNGLRSKNEMVRAEILGVLAYAVVQCKHIRSLQEMQGLLAGGDEEANFFNNIHHVQVHRRSRALRRLADHADDGLLCSSSLADIFIPLVSNYITATSSIDHHLVNEAIQTTGRLAKHVAWGAYYALVQKYLRLSSLKDESERVYIRTLVILLENFHFPVEDVVPEPEIRENDDPNAVVEADGDDDAKEDGSDKGSPSPTVIPMKSRNLARIADAVNLRLLPSLLRHLEKRDSTTEDSSRIPIAIGIVKVAKHLPAVTREPQITRLITILSQILRSRSQETRDLTRDTLARIAVSLGSSYLPLLLREMRGALLRGPHLHVLACVAHALLVHVTAEEHRDSFESLDSCVDDVVYISAEVIFGESGKDVQAEDFKTKMREVRSSSTKALDSFAIMAKYVTPSKISSLLVPLRSIMRETESIKVMQVVDEVLRRIAGGLNSNKHLVPAELLVLCHALITQNARFLKQAPLRRNKHAKGDAIVRVKPYPATQTDHYANNSYRFVTFGLDLFFTALRRNRFDLQDTSIIVRLESMVVVVGNTLYSTSSPVLVLGLRCAASIVKCPLESLGKALPVFISQVIDIIKQVGNTESEVVQAAFKSLGAILRDGPAVQVKEKDLVYLLELLAPDLEEPSRQASVFTMLRAIVSRKFVVPEIYDLMDKVSEIMVTSQSSQVQELCRGVLLQFLLDYPQGKGRLRNQMGFLARNLSYVYETGRKSVMELLGAVVAKFEVGLVREYADLLFVALVMVIANDDSAKCREMAAQLIKTLFLRLDDDRRRVMLSHLHSWASQHSQIQLSRVSSQVYGLIIDVLQAHALAYIPVILDDLNAAIERSSQQLESSEDGESMEPDLEWQVPYHALVVLSKILRIFPNLITQSNVVWNPIFAHLLFPHAWVRTASCRLLGQLFAAVPVGPGTDLADDSPFTTINLQDVAKKLCMQLKSEHLDEALSLQVVKNLFYIGKSFYAIPLPSSADDGVLDVSKGEVFDDEAENAENRKDMVLHPLPWLFSKLSYQIRSAHIARRNRTLLNSNWSHQPSSALRWFAAMASHMEAARLEKFLVHILTPVYRIIEDETIRDPQMDELKTLAVEVQDLVQSKVGPTKFSHAYSQIRQGALSVRRERKDARVMQMTTNPEAAAKRKAQRNVTKKESRKRKNRAFADNKGRLKRRREE